MYNLRAIGATSFLLAVLVMLLAVVGADSVQAQGVGGTNSIIPDIFTHAQPPVTVTIKPDSLDSEYRRDLDIILFNSVPGYDPRPETSYEPACVPYELEMFEASIAPGSASTSFEMQGAAIPWVDDEGDMRVYEFTS